MFVVHYRLVRVAAASSASPALHARRSCGTICQRRRCERRPAATSRCGPCAYSVGIDGRQLAPPARPGVGAAIANAAAEAEQDLLAARARRPVRLTDDDLAWLSHAGADIRAVFHAPSTTARERKQLLRAIVSEVVITVDATKRTAALRIIWQGGGCTDLEMALSKTGGHFRATDEDTVELVRRLAAHYDDTTIALILSRQHHRTGTGLPFTKSRVQSLRVSRGIPAHQPAENVAPDGDDAVVVTVAEGRTPAGHQQSDDLPMAARRLHYRWTL
jgi:hypothetical protein